MLRHRVDRAPARSGAVLGQSMTSPFMMRTLVYDVSAKEHALLLRVERSARICGCDLMVECQPSKLNVWVRFPSIAPNDSSNKK